MSTSRNATALDPYRDAVRHHPWWFAIVAIVGIALVVAWTLHRTPHYKATARILVTPQAADPTTAGLPLLSDSVDPTRTLQTAASMLASPQATVLTVQKLHDGETVEEVRGSVAVVPLSDENVVGVTATASSPTVAARLADAYADAALRTRRDTLDRQVTNKLVEVEAREKAIGDQTAPAAATLAGEVDELKAISQGPDPNFSLLESAVVPTSASGKSTTYRLVAGVLVAVALAVLVALIRDRLDRRVREQDELIELTSLPVLARVPVNRRHRRDVPPTGAATEALRALQIQLEAATEKPRAVVITSASSGDGKTTTAIVLAQMLASAGRRVALLDFDLRKSDVGVRLGVRSDLRPLLMEGGGLQDVLVPVDGDPDLRVLSAPPAGDVEAQAYARRLPEIIEAARGFGDIVLIDTPPVGRVADALQVAADADDLLLVVRPGHTVRRELTATQETLRLLAIVPAGLVMVGGVGGAVRAPAASVA